MTKCIWFTHIKPLVSLKAVYHSCPADGFREKQLGMGWRVVKKGSWGDNEGMMEMKRLVDTEISAFLEKEWIGTDGRRKTTRSKWRHRQGREGKKSQNSENRIQTEVELWRNRMLVDLIPRTILDSTIHAHGWSCEKKAEQSRPASLFIFYLLL